MTGCANYGYDGMEDKCTDSQPQGIMGAVYFCSFIILSSMMILNLFIGVITTSMQEAKTALTEEINADKELDAEEEMLKKLDGMIGDIDSMAADMKVYVQWTMASRLLCVTKAVCRFAEQDRKSRVSRYVRLSRKNVTSNLEADASRVSDGSPSVGGSPPAPVGGTPEAKETPSLVGVLRNGSNEIGRPRSILAALDDVAKGDT